MEWVRATVVMEWMWTHLLLLAVSDVRCLRLLALQVPESAHLGQSLSLACVFDLQGSGLYSVKWYRDGMEFFRYVPSDKPPGQFFEIPGVRVDLSNSQNGTVRITDVNWHTAGTYRCEVSAEAPSFQTVQAEKIMTVYALEDSRAIPAAVPACHSLYLMAILSTTLLRHVIR